MKKVLKLLSVVFVCSIAFTSTCQSFAAIFLGLDAVMRPTLEVPRVAVPDITFPGIMDPAPVVVTDAQVQEMKYNADKDRYPAAPRIDCKGSKKMAYERAKRAGHGKEPRHDPHGDEKNKTPHYHPDLEGYKGHTHYHYHVVLSGETLGGIAKKYGTTYQEIAKLNGISDPNKISVGQNLKIPGVPAGNSQSSNSTAKPEYITYTVKSGDTLDKIARSYNTTYQKIAQINGIANPNRISVGQTLKIPQ